jgi:hypothetical protein
MFALIFASTPIMVLGRIHLPPLQRREYSAYILIKIKEFRSNTMP